MQTIAETEYKEASVEIDRVKLKEERTLRNKQKKEAKKQRKQKEREQRELLLKIQSKGGNVTVITKDFADKIVNNSGGLDSLFQNISVDSADFPELGQKYKSRKCDNLAITYTDNVKDDNNKLQSGKKHTSKIELADFMNIPPSVSKHIKPHVHCSDTYSGNPLDSDLPIRKKGKFREVPKTKKLTKLKRNILKDQNDYELSSSEAHSSPCVENVQLLPDHIITEELNILIKTFVSSITELQEKLYKRDPIKGTSKRRYIVGLHEVKKYLKINKVKILIIATDIKIIKSDGALNNVIHELINLAKTNEIPHVYALKRRLLGTLTLKYIPVSCIAILNYEGLEDQFNAILKIILTLRNEYKELHDEEKTLNSELIHNFIAALN